LKKKRKRVVLKIKVYLQGGVDYDILEAVLKKDGFGVISAVKKGKVNKKREEHVAYATMNNAILLTDDKNFGRSYKINHEGILILYQSNDSKKVMTLQKIVNALKNIRDQVQDNRIDLRNRVYPLNVFVP